MFKKTEDSEWSRFSRALSGQSRTADEETPAHEEPRDVAPASREMREAVPSAPAPPPAPSRPTTNLPHHVRSQSSMVQQEADDVETVIGANSAFDGTLNSESSIRIKGVAQGEIVCSKSVFIEESARVNAKITAASAVIAGKLDGSIVCDARLEVLATGQVTGELTAGVLIIQEGAFFEGHLKMKDRKPGEVPAAPQPAGRRFGPSN